MRPAPSHQVLDLSDLPPDLPFGLVAADLEALPATDGLVFVKVCAGPGRREAARYRHLHSFGLAVPRMVLSLERTSDEVVVLEHLPRTGIVAGEEDELLALMASWASVVDLPDAFALPPGLPQEEFEAGVARTLECLTRRFPAVEPGPWLRAYQEALRCSADLPHALTHGELGFEQVGRTGEGRLVVFDLETAGLRPRMTDVATVLAPLARLSSRSELDLFASWLQHGGVAGAGIGVHDLWRELLRTRVVVAMEALPWLAGDPALPLADRVATLARDLTELGWG